MKISQLRLQMIIREELQLHSSASRLLREDTADMMEWAALATDLAALGMLATGVGAPAAAALSAASSALDVGAATAHFEKNNNVEGVFNLLGAALPAFPVAPAWKIFKYIKGAKVNLFKQAPAAFVKVLEMLVDQLMSFTSGLVDYLGGDDINDSLAEFRDKIKEGISDLTRDLKQIKAKMNQGNKPLKMKFPTEDAIKKAIEDHAEELEALAPLMRRAHLLHPSKSALLVKRLEQLGLEVGGLNETVRISRGQLRRIIREELEIVSKVKTKISGIKGSEAQSQDEDPLSVKDLEAMVAEDPDNRSMGSGRDRRIAVSRAVSGLGGGTQSYSELAVTLVDGTWHIVVEKATNESLGTERRHLRTLREREFNLPRYKKWDEPR